MDQYFFVVGFCLGSELSFNAHDDDVCIVSRANPQWGGKGCTKYSDAQLENHLYRIVFHEMENIFQKITELR